jgi:hypothetical protein
LDNLTLGLSTEVDLGPLASTRGNFFQELCNLKVSISQNNETVTEQFTTEEASETANFFFTEMIGGPAINRLSTFMEHYPGIGNLNPNRDHALRVRTLARNPRAPLSLRVFFRSFSKMIETFNYDTIHLWHIKQYMVSVDLLDRFNKIETMADRRDNRIAHSQGAICTPGARDH